MEITHFEIHLRLLSGAPVYISNPHFYLADPELLDAVVGLKPNQSIHESYFKIQPVSHFGLNLNAFLPLHLVSFLFHLCVFRSRQ